MNRKVTYALIAGVLVESVTTEPHLAGHHLEQVDRPASLPLDHPHTHQDAPDPDGTRNLPPEVVVSATLTPASGMDVFLLAGPDGNILRFRSK